MGHAIVTSKSTYGLTDDGQDYELLSSYTERDSQEPDEFDVEEGLTDHVAMAIDWLKRSAYVVEASVFPVMNFRAHDWFAAETYEHPYTTDREESHYTLEGYTDAEARYIAVMVLGTDAEKDMLSKGVAL